MQIPVQQKPLTPPDAGGYYDIPFIYGLNYFIPKGVNPGIDVNGFYSKPWQDIIPSQGDYEFRLRRHIPSYATSFNLLDAGSKALYSPYDLNPPDSAAGNIRGDILIAPELVFPPGAGIRVFNNDGFAFNGLGFPDTAPGSPVVWYGYYYMQGVKRIYRAPNTVPNYPYREETFIYPLNFNMTDYYLMGTPANYVPSLPKRYTLQILNYDFELQAIYFYHGYGYPISNAVTGLQAIVYDSGQHAMMSDFVDISALQAGNDNFVPGPAGCFPTPPVIYPRGSQLQIDVRSLATTTAVMAPGPQYIQLVGVNRVPC